MVRPAIRSRVTVLLGAATIVAGVLPAMTLAAPRTLAATTGATGVARGAVTVDARPLTPAEAGAIDDTHEAQPSILYEEAMAHANDRISFAPGSRVTVGFEPSIHDGWPIDGHAPRKLPAGRATGRDMAVAKQGSRWATLGAGERTTSAEPAASPGTTPSPAASDALPEASADPTATPTDDASAAPTGDPTEPSGDPTEPSADPAAVADPTAGADPAAVGSLDADANLAPSAASGLRRQVLGFLPYWELSGGAASSMRYDVLSTIAYFSVGADKAGNLAKRNSDGSLTTGWAGWTSADMTRVISAAHAAHTRVVLTVSVFAWTTNNAAIQKAILGSSTARSNLARQIAAAVRDRGADGVNLDFEPLASGYESEFVALLKSVRSALNDVHSGYQLTYDTTGFPGNYPLEASVAAGAADAIFIMGYDYRTATSNYAGSIDPLAGPAYDLADTVRSFAGRVPPSRLILGVPWYGRAWSTVSDAVNAHTQDGAKYGYSAAVNYDTAVDLAAQYGRRWDGREVTPWFAYKRQNCTSAFGCVTSWRQVYYDDVTSLKARYDLVNRYGLRGAGIWALGYQGTRTEMWTALRDRFLVDVSPPDAGVTALPSKAIDEGIVVSWQAADQSPIKSYDVQVSTDGGAWATWLSATTATSDVWLGKQGHGYAFRIRARDGKGYTSAWNVTQTWKQTPTLAKGGFGKVVVDGLSYRAGPDTTAQVIGTLDAGTVVAVTDGPISADGYTWYEVSQPIHEWGTVSFVEKGVWVPASSSSQVRITPDRAPNSTTVDAGLAGMGFGVDSALTGTSAAALAARAFSPDADSSEDSLRLRWTNRVTLDSLTLRVYRIDGSLVGSRSVPLLTTGAHAWDWDGTLDGSTAQPDGRYVLQLVGAAGGTTYRAPSARPVTPAQINVYAVTVDTVAPTIGAASASPTLFSPTGDGALDKVALTMTTAGGVSRWRMAVARLTGGVPGSSIRVDDGTGSTIHTAWDGRDDAGTVVADGAYRITLAAYDAAGNRVARSFDVVVDTRRPSVPVTAPATFSPNGDGVAETAAIRWTSDESASGTVSLLRGSTVLRRWSVSSSFGSTITWNGRTTSGASVSDGPVRIRVAVRDRAGNLTTTDRVITLDRTLGFATWSRHFYPQDHDALAATSKFTFRLVRAASVSLRVVAADGHVVRTVWTDRSMAAGAKSWTWDGRIAGGAFAAPGRYQAVVTARSWVGTTELRRAVVVDAFIVSAPASVKAGSAFTLHLRSTEPLSVRPSVTLAQSGRPAVTKSVTRLADGSYTVTFTSAPGVTGAATLTISAKDSGGRTNTTVIRIPVVG